MNFHPHIHIHIHRLEANAAALGIGKFITSITITIFYVILYYVWQEYFQVKDRDGLTNVMWILAALRVGLCLWRWGFLLDSIFRWFCLAGRLPLWAF